MSDRDDGSTYGKPPGWPAPPSSLERRGAERYGSRVDPWGRPVGSAGYANAELEVPGRPFPEARVRGRRRGSPIVNAVLFVATLVTTTMAGAVHAGVDPFADPWSIPAGFTFSVPLMLILLCHEFGHYAAALRHGVPTTLPYFIPGPPLLVGTFGAFIRMRGMPRSRRALFDVGAAGPWAGLLVALPAVVLGLMLSDVQPLSKGLEGGLSLGNSLLFNALTRLVVGVGPDDATILLHPIALAGWFGIFVTFLNLLPVGQLDGGHVVYALFGRRHRHIARLFLVVVLGMGFLGWEGWFVWAIMLTFVVKVDHPDTMDADTPLDGGRKIAAWATIAVFALTFMPIPLSVVQPDRVPVRIEQEPLRPPTLKRAPSRPAPVPPPGFDDEEPGFDRDDRPMMNVGAPSSAIGAAELAEIAGL
ncbi:MAG TPA: site-2 protease family protein [Candidatus Binatia bacterium]|nr:site-2 protease family protein [Candidatus Binatia bacterium]